MKWFLALVLFLNLLLGLYGLTQKSPTVDIHAQEVSPQLLKLLPFNWVSSAAVSSTTAQQNHAASQAFTKEIESKKPVASATVHIATVCLRWDGLSVQQSASIKNAFASLKITEGQWRETTNNTAVMSKKNIRYWVYYPAQVSGEVTNAMSADLYSKGFENYIVQKGDDKGAMSLGLFAKEDVAKSVVERLRAAGYTEAKIRARLPANANSIVATLTFNNLTPQQANALLEQQKKLAIVTAPVPLPCP